MLNNILVIATSELWSIDCQNPAIKICETLKRKGWITLFSLWTVMIAGWTICPFHMDLIHRTNTAWQPYGILVPTYATQFGDIRRNANILIFHFHKGPNKNKKLHTSKVHMPHIGLQERNAAPVAKRYRVDITNNSEHSQNTLQRQWDLGLVMYPQSIKIVVSSSTLARDMQTSVKIPRNDCCLRVRALFCKSAWDV